MPGGGKVKYYDYLIVGAVFAFKANKIEKNV